MPTLYTVLSMPYLLPYSVCLTQHALLSMPYSVRQLTMPYLYTILSMPYSICLPQHALLIYHTQYARVGHTESDRTLYGNYHAE